MKELYEATGGYSVVERFILRSDTILEEQQVPLHDVEAIAGIISQEVDDYVPLEEITVPQMPKSDGAVHVRGDSMFPLLRAGDIVLYKTTNSRRANLHFGEMYLLAFDIEGEEYITVKFLHLSDTPGYYRLESFNPSHAPREVPIDCVRALARVTGSVRYCTIE